MTTAMIDDISLEAAQDAEGEALTVSVEEFSIAKHDATLTLVSPRSGEHRTFRIRSIHRGNLAGKRVVELLVGSDNTSDYQGFGWILDGGRIVVWKRFRGENGDRSQHERFADLLERPVYWSGRGVEYMLALRCRRCGRLLTHRESLADGYGPICRQKAGV